MPIIPISTPNEVASSFYPQVQTWINTWERMADATGARVDGEYNLFIADFTLSWPDQSELKVHWHNVNQNMKLAYLWDDRFMVRYFKEEMVLRFHARLGKQKLRITHMDMPWERWSYALKRQRRVHNQMIFLGPFPDRIMEKLIHWGEDILESFDLRFDPKKEMIVLRLKWVPLSERDLKKVLRIKEIVEK